jgi:hypothetical protein
LKWLFFLDLSMVDRRLHDDLRKIYLHLKAPRFDLHRPPRPSESTPPACLGTSSPPPPPSRPACLSEPIHLHSSESFGTGGGGGGTRRQRRRRRRNAAAAACRRVFGSSDVYTTRYTNGYSGTRPYRRTRLSIYTPMGTRGYIQLCTLIHNQICALIHAHSLVHTQMGALVRARTGTLYTEGL